MPPFSSSSSPLPLLLSLFFWQWPHSEKHTSSGAQKEVWDLDRFTLHYRKRFTSLRKENGLGVTTAIPPCVNTQDLVISGDIRSTLCWFFRQAPKQLISCQPTCNSGTTEHASVQSTRRFAIHTFSLSLATFVIVKQCLEPVIGFSWVSWKSSLWYF